jgi:hypothetical protein
MLLIGNTPYKSMFNGPYNAIFLEPFGGHCGEDQYLLGFVFLYLENLHSSEHDVPIFVEHNPFGRIKCIDQNNLTLFKYCLWNVIKPTNPLFVIVRNWNWNKKYPMKCSSSNFSCLNI